MIYWIIGIICVIGSILTIKYQVKELEIGPNASRFVAVICGVLGYFVVAEWISATIPLLELRDASSWIFKVVVIAGFFVWLFVYAYKARQNWRVEFNHVTKNAPWVLLVVGLLIIARYCFAVASR